MSFTAGAASPADAEGIAAIYNQGIADRIGCGQLLRPKPGHCCVFCSFGSIPCPPMQEADIDSGCCGSDGARNPIV
jgi:hypothetical protein